MGKVRILIIDDERGMREGCRRILESEGYTVETAENGEVGLSKIRERPFDLALLDLKMPGLSGIEVLKQIRHTRLEIIPIMITGHASVQTAVEAMKLGAFDYVEKPFTPDDLLAIVAKALEGRKEELEAERTLQARREQAMAELRRLDVIDDILQKYDYTESGLIAILQDIQRKMNYLPQSVLRFVANRLNVPLTRVYGIATFYKAFSLKPRGRHLINVCLGTACHVRGGVRIMERLERELDIKAGETTYDARFSMESVRCVGCCGLAPVVVIDDNFHGKLTQDKIPKILRQYE
ncbi:MAG: NADH-quinone oxidoreductase subunit NuoE [bacterium]